MSAMTLESEQFVLGGHGADDDVAAIGLDALEVGNAAEIDQIGRGREAQLHHRDEAVAAGDGAGVLAELGEQTDGFLDRRRAMIVERPWYHGRPPPWHRTKAQAPSWRVPRVRGVAC